MTKYQMRLKENGAIASLGCDQVLEGTEAECLNNYVNYLIAQEGFKHHFSTGCIFVEYLHRDGRTYRVVAEKRED